MKSRFTKRRCKAVACAGQHLIEVDGIGTFSSTIPCYGPLQLHVHDEVDETIIYMLQCPDCKRAITVVVIGDQRKIINMMPDIINILAATHYN